MTSTRSPTRSTPGAWTDSPGIRGSAQVHDDEFTACVTLQAPYIWDTDFFESRPT